MGWQKGTGSSVLPVFATTQELTEAQRELYDWLADYIGSHRHSP